MLASSRGGIHGSDATYSTTWAHALCETFLSGKEVHRLTISDGAKTVGILPYYRESDGIYRRLKVITEAHAGRSSMLVLDDSQKTCADLLVAAYEKIAAWDTLQLTVVENSAAHLAVCAKSADKALPLRCISTIESPYIVLGADWNETFAVLPKKLRWTIRKAEKDLSSLGKLTYRAYTHPDQIAEFFQILYEIERGSWKEKSGTSITVQKHQQTFYEALARHASRDGIFSAHALHLDDKPLAYILGLLSRDGSFLDLKESFVESHSQYSPAHVLKRFAIPALIDQGVRLYDFMGVCEPYKMRWTDKTYRRHTIVLHNHTLRGRLSYCKALLSRSSTSVPPPSPTISQVPGQNDS